MNKKDQDTFLLMSEIEDGEPRSQREIASRLGIALGLVNTYLKTLVKKGFVQIRDCPSNRYAYLLTPQGIAEKSRLAYQQVHIFNRLFRVSRHDSLSLFHQLKRRGCYRVAFCGVDEFTEISFLSLKEVGLNLVAVMDVRKVGDRFLDQSVISLEEGVAAKPDAVVITAWRRAEMLQKTMLENGFAGDSIFMPEMNFSEMVEMP